MNNKVNSWSEFQPLEEIVIGSTFAPEFYDDVKNSNIRDAMQRIASETEEDLQNLKTTLEDMGVVCHKPTPTELGFNESILDYCDDEGKAGLGSNNGNFFEKGKNLIPVPPLNPRDDIITMGDKVFFTSNVWNFKPWQPWFEEKYGKDQIDSKIMDESLRFNDTNFVRALRLHRMGHMPAEVLENSSIQELHDWGGEWLENNRELIARDEKLQSAVTGTSCGFCAPQLTRIGKDCIIDLSERADIDTYMEEYFPEFHYIKTQVGGHNDSVFAMVKPGLTFHTRDLEQYDDIIPHNWDRVQLDFTLVNQAPAEEFMKIKRRNGGRWWVPGEEGNNEFGDFVNTWLDDWVGQCDETVFDVNLLMVNENTAIVNAYNEELFKIFKKHNVEPVVVKNRHRFFWDAGWHCVTVDVRRTGDQEDYGLGKELGLR